MIPYAAEKINVFYAYVIKLLAKFMDCIFKMNNIPMLPNKRTTDTKISLCNHDVHRDIVYIFNTCLLVEQCVFNCGEYIGFCVICKDTVNNIISENLNG